MKKILISILLLLCTSSCTTIKEVFTVEEDKIIEEKNLNIFFDLVKQGWQIQLYEGKVIVVKEVNGKLLVNDVFNILEE